MFVASGPGEVCRGSTGNCWGEKVDFQLCLGEYLVVENLLIHPDALYAGHDILLRESTLVNPAIVRAPAATAQKFAVALDAFRLRAVEDADLAMAMRAEIAFFKAIKKPDLMGQSIPRVGGGLGEHRKAAVQKIFGSYFHTYWGPDFKGYGSPFKRNTLVLASQYASDFTDSYFIPALYDRLVKDGFWIENYGSGVWYMTPRR